MKHLVHGTRDQDRLLRCLTIADYLDPMPGAMADSPLGGRETAIDLWLCGSRVTTLRWSKDLRIEEDSYQPLLSRLLGDPAMQELGCLRCWGGKKEWTHLVAAFLGFGHAFA